MNDLLVSNQNPTLKEGFKGTFCTYYKKVSNDLCSFLIFLSLIDQIILMHIFEEKLTSDENLNLVERVFSLELLISYLFTVDFCLKLWIHEVYLDSQGYGRIYLFIDGVAGPTSLMHDIIWLFVFEQYSVVGFMLRFSKIFRGEGSRKIIRQIILITPRICPLFFTLFSIFYIFSSISKAMYNIDFPEYFGTLGRSMFTMFQIMTLDGWGDIGRGILKEKGMISALFIWFYILVMTYFLLNLLTGFVIECVEKSMGESPQDIINEEEGEEPETSFSEKVIVGTYYDKFVFVLFFMNLLEIYTYASSSFYQDTVKYFVHHLAVIYELFLGIAYTFHFSLLYVKRGSYALGPNKTNVSSFYMFIHFLSGPVSLIMDIHQYRAYNYLQIGPQLRIFKILTLSFNRAFLTSFLKIIPKLMPPFGALVGIIFLLGFWATERLRFALPTYFGDLNLSMFSFFQIITLDDWCGTVTRSLMDRSQEATFVMVLYIFVGTFIFLNILTAIACDQMKECSVKTSPKTNTDAAEQLFPAGNEKRSEKFCINNSLSSTISNLIKKINKNHSYLYEKRLKDYSVEKIEREKVELTNPEEIETYYFLREGIRRARDLKAATAYDMNTLVSCSNSSDNLNDPKGDNQQHGNSMPEEEEMKKEKNSKFLLENNNDGWKKMGKDAETETITIEFEGKSITLKNLSFLSLNSNVEILLDAKIANKHNQLLLSKKYKDEAREVWNKGNENEARFSITEVNNMKGHDKGFGHNCLNYLCQNFEDDETEKMIK